MVRIVPLDAESWDALAEFGRSNESSDLHWCWCQYWRLRSKDFGALKVPELRARLAALAASPEAPGLVALEPAPDGSGETLDGGRPPERAIGWVSLGPIASFERIVRSKVIPRVDDRPVWSIVCFSVAASARGRGIGTALLEAAVDHARERGALALEAYPVVADGDEAIVAEAAFTGTLSMFERAGFGIVSDRASGPSSRYRRVVVRREL
jgi:GNAT superfamily N-acetyltransferase